MDISLSILKLLSASTRDVYDRETSAGMEGIIPLVVKSASSIIRSATKFGGQAERELEYFYKRFIMESVTAVEELVLVSRWDVIELDFFGILCP